MRRPKSSSLLLGLLTVGGLVPVLVSGGCNGADNPNTGNKVKPGPTTNTWTLMAFNMGRNESDNYSLSVANQLQGASAPASINFETAFSGINVNNPPFTTSRRITVKAGVASVFADLGQKNMSDSTELSDYVTDGIRLGQSSRHCLVISGHGGLPVRNVGADTLATGSFDLAGLDTALATARSATGLAKIEIVVLDMPSSATSEVLAVLAKHANFFVGFEGAATSSGIDVAGVLATLNGNSKIDPSALAISIANTVPSNANTKAPSELAEVAVVCVDLSKTTALFGALNNLAGSLTADIASNTPAAVAVIASARTSAVELDKAIGTELVDLSSLASTIAPAGGAGPLSAATVNAANSVTAQITNVLTSATVTSEYTPAKGLAIYLPTNSKRLASNYNNAAAAFLAAVPNWGTFLTTYHQGLNTTPPTPTVTPSFPVTIMTTGPANNINVTGSVGPTNLVKEVEVFITYTIGTNDTIAWRSGPQRPSPAGSVAFLTSAQFVSFRDAANLVSEIFVPIQPQVSKGGSSVMPADCRFVSGASNVTRSGFVKVAGVAQINTLTATAFTPIPSNGAIGRNDSLTSASINYAVFPQVLLISGATGTITVASQVSNGYVPAAAGVTSFVVNGRTLPSVTSVALPGKIWMVAETYNGERTAVQAPLTIQ